MEIVIDLESSEAIFSQLIRQIKEAVSKGNLKSGDPLPSIRQLANDLDVNNKTIAKAYKLLERDQIIQARGYRGSFIHPNAKEHCDIDLGAWVKERLTDVIDELKSEGVTNSEIRIAFSELMNNRN